MAHRLAAPAQPRAEGSALPTTDRLDWGRDGQDWPHRDLSRFVEAAGLRWHVQHWQAHAAAPHTHPAHGSGGAAAMEAASSSRTRPLILLIHGTGASTHSWRDLAPLLAEHADVLAMDLPGHAFSSMPAGGANSDLLSLPGMASAVSKLLHVLDLEPQLIVGHSAGAAVGVRMALDRQSAPQQPGRAALQGVLGLNAALLPLRGLAGQLFSPVAKLMASTSMVPRYFASRAGDAKVLQRLIDSTGSRLDAAGLRCYARLVSSPGHAAGALGMMANWDLEALAYALPRLKTPLHLMVGTRDGTVPPAQAERVLARLPEGLPHSLLKLEGLGHLAHEERPAVVAEWVRSAAADGPRLSPG